MEHEHRAGARNGSAGTGHLHADRRLPPRVRSIRRQAQAGVHRQMSVQLDLTERVGWPFFTPEHRTAAELVTKWSREHLLGAPHGELRTDVDAQARKLVAGLGSAGITRYCVRADHGGVLQELDSRAICLIRETLAYHDGLADFAFAMQGLGSGALSIAGDAKLQQQYLPRVASGGAIAAFALSEPDAGSDVAAMQSSAQLDGDHYVLNGIKTWISNGGIADIYCVFARTTPGQKRADGTVGAQGITAFLVEPSDPGFSVEGRIDVIAPHPLGTLRFDNCRIPVNRRIGEEGDGFKIA